MIHLLFTDGCIFALRFFYFKKPFSLSLGIRTAGAGLKAFPQDMLQLRSYRHRLMLFSLCHPMVVSGGCYWMGVCATGVQCWET